MNNNNRVFVFTLILIVIIMWSGNFVSIAYIVKEVEPYTALTIRFAVVALILSPFLLKLPPLKESLFLLLATIAIVPGHFGLLFLSIEYTKNLGGISVLLQLSIPFSILLSWYFYKDRPSNLRLIGLIISFLGILFLLYDPSLLSSQLAFFIAIGSALCLGIYFVIVKKIKSLKSMQIVAWSSLIGIPMMYTLMLVNNQSLEIIYEIENWQTVFAFFYTVIGSSIIGHGIWAYLIKTEDISFISPFLLLIPMITTLLSMVMLKEIISMNFIIISSIIIFGIFLVFISKDNKIVKENNANTREN